MRVSGTSAFCNRGLGVKHFRSVCRHGVTVLSAVDVAARWATKVRRAKLNGGLAFASFDSPGIRAAFVSFGPAGTSDRSGLSPGPDQVLMVFKPRAAVQRNGVPSRHM